MFYLKIQKKIRKSIIYKISEFML